MCALPGSKGWSYIYSVLLGGLFLCQRYWQLFDYPDTPFFRTRLGNSWFVENLAHVGCLVLRGLMVSCIVYVSTTISSSGVYSVGGSLRTIFTRDVGRKETFGTAMLYLFGFVLGCSVCIWKIYLNLLSRRNQPSSLSYLY